ncbi:SpoIIE family protein phosphatase [Streptomyces sioyaensis]|uniref:SpoIIE family protein phosphatase n=1 Tax=Streptomyces sioyaensis TaxID=67364 RepID=UPI003787B5F6
MSTSPVAPVVGDGRGRGGASSAARTAMVTVDSRGVVVAWSREAENLLGYPRSEVLGRPAVSLLAGPFEADLPTSVHVRHRDGHRVACQLQLCPDRTSADHQRWSVALTATEAWPPDGFDSTIVESLLRHSPVALVVCGPDLRLLRINHAAEALHTIPQQKAAAGRRLSEAWPGLLGERAEEALERALASGAPAAMEMRFPPPRDPRREHIFQASAFPLHDGQGRPVGAALAVVDVTDRRQAQECLSLLAEAGTRLGTSLDVLSTARELTEMAVPRLADSVCVDAVDAVLRGEEPALETVGSGLMLRRAASRSTRTLSSTAYPVGELTTVPATVPTPHNQCLADLRPRLISSLDPGAEWLAQDPVRSRRIIDEGIHSLMVVPLCVRGAVLGIVSFYRSALQPGPYRQEDLSLATELVDRTAVCLHHALRYTHERNATLVLQRSLCTHDVPTQSAVEIAYGYTPSDTTGAWFDVVPLSGARVALVIGEAQGHGLQAAAGMAQLRAALSALADLDLPPDEILARMNDLVVRRDLESQVAEEGCVLAGSSCLYLVYDPVLRQCTFARAGNPAPVVVLPDGAVQASDCPARPALGVGEEPFRKVDLELPEGALLALSTDGLLRAKDGDPRSGPTELERVLTRPGPSVARGCRRITQALPPEEAAALLVIRTRALAPYQVATWDLPTDPAVVGTARALAEQQLALWDLTGTAFTTVLVISELITNAIRHARGPVRLRLIRDRTLTCEVSDGSSSAPHLRHARTVDEGGRGLFIVAQLTQRWGVRYGNDGKTIWAEQALTADSGD